MMADASYEIPWDGYKIMPRYFRADRGVARLGHNVRARLRSFIPYGAKPMRIFGGSFSHQKKADSAFRKPLKFGEIYSLVILK